MSTIESYYDISKFSEEPNALPPETITSAAVRSGLSLSAISSLTKLELFKESTTAPELTVANESVMGDASKAVVLTVITFTVSLDLTVAIQLPA